VELEFLPFERDQRLQQMLAIVKASIKWIALALVLHSFRISGERSFKFEKKKHHGDLLRKQTGPTTHKQAASHRHTPPMELQVFNETPAPARPMGPVRQA
jgi:hypothetical protein